MTNAYGTNKVREYIREANIDALEELVLAGHGQSLINQPSTDKNVRSFLRTVPSYMVSNANFSQGSQV